MLPSNHPRGAISTGIRASGLNFVMHAESAGAQSEQWTDDIERGAMGRVQLVPMNVVADRSTARVGSDPQQSHDNIPARL